MREPGEAFGMVFAVNLEVDVDGDDDRLDVAGWLAAIGGSIGDGKLDRLDARTGLVCSELPEWLAGPMGVLLTVAECWVVDWGGVASVGANVDAFCAVGVLLRSRGLECGGDWTSSLSAVSVGSKFAVAAALVVEPVVCC